MGNVIVGSSTLVAGNIKNGVTIFGVKGTFAGVTDNPLYIVKNRTLQIPNACQFTGWASYGSGWSGWSRYYTALWTSSSVYNALSQYSKLVVKITVNTWFNFRSYSNPMCDYVSSPGATTEDRSLRRSLGSIPVLVPGESYTMREFSIDWASNRILRYILIDINSTSDIFSDVEMYLSK